MLDSRNIDITDWMVKEMQLASASNGRRNLTNRFLLKSQDSTNFDSTKMHVYSKLNRSRDTISPNRDVVRLLRNPEQALKKNL